MAVLLRQQDEEFRFGALAEPVALLHLVDVVPVRVLAPLLAAELLVLELERRLARAAAAKRGQPQLHRRTILRLRRRLIVHRRQQRAGRTRLGGPVRSIVSPLSGLHPAAVRARTCMA